MKSNKLKRIRRFSCCLPCIMPFFFLMRKRAANSPVLRRRFTFLSLHYRMRKPGNFVVYSFHPQLPKSSPEYIAVQMRVVIVIKEGKTVLQEKRYLQQNIEAKKLPYYRKLTLVLIKVFEINTT